MSKKDFTGGLNTLLGETSPEEITEQPTASKKKKVGRPKTRTWEPQSSLEEGTLQGEMRATFILKKEMISKVKAIAYWERAKIKDVIDTALTDFINKYEKENGEIKPAPETNK